MKPWQFDETQQVGVNYHDEREAQAYDEKMRRLRDIPGEVNEIATALGIGPDSVVWDIGTGTGECALGLAARCKQVYATDISEAMLACAKGKLEQRPMANITNAMEVVRQKAGDTVARQTAEHIRDEYSTFDWILEGLLERNGLEVIEKNPMGFLTVYVCRKTVTGVTGEL